MHYFVLFLTILLLNTGLFAESNLTLKNILSQASHITEINQDTVGFSEEIFNSLSKKNPQPKRYLSISVNNIDKKKLKNLYVRAKKENIEFTFWRINDSYIEIEPTDVLLLNPMGTYHHMSFALDTFGKNVRKYICIPNMYKDDLPVEREDPYEGDYFEYPNPIPKSDSIGVWQAVKDFLDSHHEWKMVRIQQTEMLILFRSDNAKPVFQLPSQTTKVEYYLKNKIILCTGPSLGRYTMLKENLESELRLIPYKKIYIRTNDDQIANIKFPKFLVDSKRIPCIEKLADCWNCIITSLKAAVNDPSTDNDDIIVFKHETVFLNDLCLFKRAIHKMLNGANMIVRSYFGGTTSDIFMVKVSAVKSIINQLEPVESFPCNKYVELMLCDQIAAKIEKVYCIELGTAPLALTNTSTWGSNGFGFYHKHPYFRFSHSLNLYVDWFGQKFWDKQNYFQLFNGNYKLSNHKYYLTLIELFEDVKSGNGQYQ